MTPLPTAAPSEQTAEYVRACTAPSVIALDAIEAAARTCSRDINAAVQQVGVWQRELRDAEFEETSGELLARMHNCDQRQRAMLTTLNELASALQQMRVHVANLRADQAELARCAEMGGE